MGGNSYAKYDDLSARVLGNIGGGHGEETTLLVAQWFIVERINAGIEAVVAFSKTAFPTRHLTAGPPAADANPAVPHAPPFCRNNSGPERVAPLLDHFRNSLLRLRHR